MSDLDFNPAEVYSNTGANNEWCRKCVTKGDRIYFSGEYESYSHPFFGSYKPQFGDFTFESAGDQDIYVASVSVTATPTMPELGLNITKQANSFILSWPSSYSNLVVEFSTELNPDSWDNLNLLPTLENDQWKLTIPIPLSGISDAGFYRLSSQE